MTDGPLCNELLTEVRCDLPYGHPEHEHHAELPLPPSLNRVLAEQLNTLEDAEQRWNKARRWMWLCASCWLIGLAANLISLWTRG